MIENVWEKNFGWEILFSFVVHLKMFMNINKLSFYTDNDDEWNKIEKKEDIIIDFIEPE